MKERNEDGKDEGEEGRKRRRKGYSPSHEVKEIQLKPPWQQTKAKKAKRTAALPCQSAWAISAQQFQAPTMS